MASITTYLATEVIDAMRDHDLIGLPRLVRLNPAVPWKTRGNAALCLRFGHGKGPCQMVGMIRDGPIHSYPECVRLADPELVMDRCSQLLRKWSRVQEDASPGLVVSRKKPRASLYWSAVRGIVQKSEVLEELDRIGAARFELEGGGGHRRFGSDVLEAEGLHLRGDRLSGAFPLGHATAGL